MRRTFLALPLSVALAGCATEWSADMPAVTYTGVVVSSPQRTPAASAEITAVRPRQNLSFCPTALLIPYESRDELIGKKLADSDGHFTLTTTGGYATRLVAVSADGWLEESVDAGLKHNRTNLTVTLHAATQDISYRKVSLSEGECRLLFSAFGKMIEHYVATGRRQPLSIEAYRARGLFTPEEEALLVRLQPHLLGEHPDIEMVFARCTVRIDSFARPVRYEPHRESSGTRSAFAGLSS